MKLAPGESQCHPGRHRHTLPHPLCRPAAHTVQGACRALDPSGGPTERKLPGVFRCGTGGHVHGARPRPSTARRVPSRLPAARAHLLALVLPPPAPRARPGLPLLRRLCRRRPVLVALPAAGAAPQQLPGRTHPAADTARPHGRHWPHRDPAREPGADANPRSSPTGLGARSAGAARPSCQPLAPPPARGEEPSRGGAMERGGAEANRCPIEAGLGRVGRTLGGAEPWG